MPSPTDTLHAKTDAELLFFIENPSLYQPELVETARRELRRRGALPQPAAAPAAPRGPLFPEAEEEEAGRRSPALLLALLALVLSVAALGFFKLKQRPAPPLNPTSATAPPNALSPDSLKLETVATHALPTYDLDALVAAQVASTPAAERQQAAALRQFRELSRRFWAAETQSEFLVSQAHAGTPGPAFAEQAVLARETWRNWNKAVVYSYAFGPVMQKQLGSMKDVASSQQHILENLPALLPDKRFLTDKELTAREADVQAWMANLRPVSPVTGKKYTVPEVVLKY